MEKRQLNIRISAATHEMLANKAAQDHLSLTDVMELFCENYIANKLMIDRTSYKVPILVMNESTPDVVIDKSVIEKPEKPPVLPASAAKPVTKTDLGKRTKSVNLNIRMTPEDRDALNAKARSEGFSTTKVIDILFENYLNGNIQIGKPGAEDTRSKTL